MTEKLRTPEINTENIAIPINQRAKEGIFNDSEIFGITDDLPIVLNLLRTQGIQIPSSGALNELRGELTIYLGIKIVQPPLYLHRC
jgi:hypothetical protein